MCKSWLGWCLGLGTFWLCLNAKADDSSSLESYFNQNPAAQYREPYRDVLRHGDDLEAVFTQAIHGARQRVWLAVQELRLPEVARALADKAEQGLDVRVLLENNYNFRLADVDWKQLHPENRSHRRILDYSRLVDLNGDGQLSPSEIAQGDALSILQQAGIPIQDDTADGSRGSGLMHHKFLVIDEHSVVVSSANLTPSDVHGDMDQVLTRGNANASLRIQSKQTNAIFAREFGIQWGDPLYGSSQPRFGIAKPYRGVQTVELASGERLSIQFSPSNRRMPYAQTTGGLIDRTLEGARQQVDLALFVFSDQNLVDRLASQLDRQAEFAVRGLIDPHFAFQYYSKVLDMWGLTLPTADCLFPQVSRPWRVPARQVGVPYLQKGDYLHHKFAVVDGQTVLFGSQNWTDAAVFTNEETLMVVESRQTARRFEQEFERLLEDSQLGAPDWLHQRVKERLKSCNP